MGGRQVNTFQLSSGSGAKVAVLDGEQTFGEVLG